MDESPIAPQPTILPPQNTSPVYGVPVESPPIERPSPIGMFKKFVPLVAIFGILLIILVVSSLVVKQVAPPTPTIDTTPTPSRTTEIISSRALSYFATDSAFMKFDAAVEQLPKTIQGAVVQDPSVLPPMLDLSLGFSN